jgi:DNA-binding transcriptional LysR family regulator
MIAARIELRHLAHFVAACQNPTISDAARELDIAPSALSSGLRALEQELQLKLFLRRGGHISPLPAAFWLFERALETLHAEETLRQLFRRKAFAPARLTVRLDLSLTIGRVSKAINRAIADMAEWDPGAVVEPRFVRRGEAPAPPEATKCAAEAGETRIDIGYCPPSGEPGAGMEPFHDDAWFSVGLADRPSRDDGSSVPLMLPDMRPILLDDIRRHALVHGFAERLKPVDGEPADLARLLAAYPQARFLMPGSMIAERLGLVRLHAEPLDPPLVSRIGARVSGPDAARARRFVALLRARLEGEEANTVFAPRLTARQIHYFNLVQRCGGISAAARVANVTQPSISSQIHKMEEALVEPLFVRHRDGVAPTPDGHHLYRLTLTLEESLDRIGKASRDIAAHQQSIIAIGTLPSSGHDSAMTDKIAEALTLVRASHPASLLRVVEATNAVLHERVRAGDLNLAVVGAVLPPIARIPLGRAERLSVVAHPALGLGGRAEISLEEAVRLPLVLGARHLSIHQAFVAAAEARHLGVEPVMEASSLPLAIAMVRRARIATVLPLSSVRQDLRAGRLTATPLADDVAAGKIAVIFSPERELSEAERAVIQALTAAFAEADPAR